LRRGTRHLPGDVVAERCHGQAAVGQVLAGL